MTVRKHKFLNSASWAGIVLSLALVVSILGTYAPAQAAISATFTVTNTDDSGPGSLRQAILDANANGESDTIEFDITGPGVHTISPLSALPIITEEVIIDGLTQTGASCDSWPPTLLIELDGSNAGASIDGLNILAGNSTVRGLVINQFGNDGIRLDFAGSNTVACNYIGTDASGTTDAGNTRHGVFIYAISDNVVGGTTISERNLISGNDGQGILIGYGSTATSNRVEGNYIGTNAAGTAALGNGQDGVSISGGQNNTVGGTTEDARNIISSNYHGISIGSSASGNLVQNNYIGTDVTGSVSLGNTWNGLRANNAQSTSVLDNVISNSGQIGVVVEGTSTGTIIQGNLIGTDATGTAAMGNGGNAGTNNFSGMSIGAPSSGTTIGGTGANEGNVIAASFWDGIRLDGSSGNVVQGNHIGTGVSGTEVLGNARCGLSIRADASSNTVGGTDPGESNIIANNGTDPVAGEGDGVCVFSGTGNLISGNRIFANRELGIDLLPSGVTPNDFQDVDTGANNLQNYPVISSVVAQGGQTTVQGTLNSTPNTAFQLEFFYSTTQDPSNHGEGEIYLGSTPASTDGNGDASFTAIFAIELTDGNYVSSTATDPSENTSEFSQALEASTPTAVFLTAFEAYDGGDQVVVEWETATEIDNLGFNLYRSASLAGERVRLNASLLPSQNPGGAIGARYQFVDQSAQPGIGYYYWLEDVDVFGSATLHGPVEASMVARRVLRPMRARPVAPPVLSGEY